MDMEEIRYLLGGTVFARAKAYTDRIQDLNCEVAGNGVRHLSAVIGLAEEEGAEAFFSALESGLTAETQKKDRTTMPGMSENPFDKVFLVPPAGTDAAMTERLLEKARYHFDAELCGSLAEAVELARANSRRGLLICGGEAIALEAADLLAEK